MVVKKRTPGNIAISISMTQGLLDDVDKRAAALGLNRSQFFALLAKRDIEERGPMVLQEAGQAPKPSIMTVAPVVVGSRELTKYSPIKRK